MRERFAKGNRAEPLPGARWTRMRRIYTYGGKPASRNLTIADLRAAKGKRKFTQVTLFIPSFYYQMAPKIPLNTRCSISISKNLSINGRTRSSDQLGIWSYNINP